ncbi:MAG: NUDIX hydrolase [Haloquadratum sp.]|jgi:ADP-ribose pyrophosphatase|nr:NUDIX hydrolase [Haloferacaceae archaeon]MDR9444860.1 NUDIX hydrolase [Haloquadratum sp.]
MPDDGRRYAPVDAPSWPVTESVTEYETTWYTGGYDMVVHPDGSQKRYYWAELAAAVVIVAVTEDAVVCVEQYRPTIRQRHLELPAGIVEADESYPAAGRRELEEETGYLAGTVEELQRVWCATGLLRHERAYVIATDLEPTRQRLDANEYLEVREVPRSQVLAHVRRQPTNEATIEGILLAKEDGYL